MTVEQQFETSLRIKTSSMTLTKHDIGDLGRIVSKGAEGSRSSRMRFLVAGGKESVKTENIEQLVNSKWPLDVDYVDLVAYSQDSFVRATLEAGVTGANRIDIAGSDSDWVTLRAKEVEDFLAEHRNWHWLLHNVTSIFLLSLSLAALIGFASSLTFELSFEKAFMVGGFTLIAIVACAQGLIRIYPFILVESGRSSAFSKARKFLNWFIPTLIAGVVLEVIFKLIF